MIHRNILRLGPDLDSGILFGTLSMEIIKKVAG